MATKEITDSFFSLAEAIVLMEMVEAHQVAAVLAEAVAVVAAVEINKK